MQYGHCRSATRRRALNYAKSRIRRMPDIYGIFRQAAPRICAAHSLMRGSRPRAGPSATNCARPPVDQDCPGPHRGRPCCPVGGSGVVGAGQPCRSGALRRECRCRREPRRRRQGPVCCGENRRDRRWFTPRGPLIAVDRVCQPAPNEPEREPARITNGPLWGSGKLLPVQLNRGTTHGHGTERDKLGHSCFEAVLL